MQQHQQSVFMIEQLQPSWLANSRERVVYTLASRLIVGLIYGAAFGAALWWYSPSAAMIGGSVTLGLGFGLLVGVLDVYRLAGVGGRAKSGMGALWQCIKSVCVVWLMELLLSILVLLGLLVVVSFGGRDAGGASRMSSDDLLFFSVCSWLLFSPSFAVICVLRNAQRTPGCDIQSAETMAWSSGAGVRGGAIGFAIGSVPALVLAGVVPRRDTLVALLIAIPPGLLFGTVAGLTTGIQEMKTMPNQGMKLSMRCAICAGLIVGLIAAISLGLFSGFFPGFVGDKRGLSDRFMASLHYGLVPGLVVAFIAGSWFGGLDVLLHYVLRLFLYLRGRTPLNIARFLDHAANDLNFLQKVGGGYIFIHRMLLEHFAAMQIGGTPNLRQRVAHSAQTTIESIFQIDQ
jgi:eukaryotic-like serine/threonine-protein kinase